MRLGKREHLRGCAGKTNAPSQALAPSPSSSLGPASPGRCLPPTPLSMHPVTLKPIPTLVPLAAVLTPTPARTPTHKCLYASFSERTYHLQACSCPADCAEESRIATALCLPLSAHHH